MSLGNGTFLNLTQTLMVLHKKGRPSFRALTKPSNLSYSSCVKGSMWNRRPLHTAAAASAQHRHTHSHPRAPPLNLLLTQHMLDTSSARFCWRRSRFSIRRPLTFNMKKAFPFDFAIGSAFVIKSFTKRNSSEGVLFLFSSQKCGKMEGRREGGLLPNVSVQLSSDFYTNFCRLPVKM